MKLKDLFKQLGEAIPELGKGANEREAAAKQCAEADAPILNRSVAELTTAYEELFFHICTEEMFESVKNATAKERERLIEHL